MYERSLVADLMGKIDRVVREQGAASVTRVAVRLGALSHLSAEHFRGHFVEATAGTAAAGAALDITEDADPAAPGAQDVVLESIEVEVPEQ